MAFGIAVLGLDHWYTAFGVLDICAASAETPLVAVYEPDAVRRAEVAAMYPGVFVTDDADAVLSAPGVELAAVCARTGDAVELSKRALIAGKHVVSVKPFARTLDEAKDVLQVAALSGKFFGSFEGMQRLHPRAELLKDIVASGAVGEIVAFHQVAHGGLPAPWRDAEKGGDSWWLDPAQVPGGAWIDHAIYSIDLARFALGGEIELGGSNIGDPYKVSGTLGNRLHKDLPVEDYGVATMTLRRESGAETTLLLTNTWCAEPGTGYSEYRFLGTRGTIAADGYSAWIVTTKEGTTRREVPESAFFRFDKLATLLKDGIVAPFGKRDAYENLAACLRVYGE